MNNLTGLNHCQATVCGLFAKIANFANNTSIIKRRIFAPAIPAMAALWFASLVGISDAYLAGKISKAALAAMSFCEPLWFLVTLLTTGMCSGISVGLASKCKYPEQIKTSAETQFFIANGLFISAIAGIILLCAALLLAFVLLNHPLWLSRTAKIVADYFIVVAISNLPFAIMQAQCAIFRAVNKGKNVIAIWGIATFIEIALSNLLFFLGFHNLTVFAIAWTLGCYIASAVGFALIKPLMPNFKIRTYIQNDLPKHGLGATITSVLAVGLPVVLGELGLLCGSILNPYILSILPDPQNLEAVWTIKTRLEETVAIVPITAIALTVAPFISWHCIREQDKKVAASIVHKASLLAGFMQLAVAILLQFCARPIAESFNLNVCAINQTAQTICITSFAFPLFAVACILAAALEGIGKAMQVTIATVIINLPVRVLFTFALKDYGITGVAVANVLIQALATIAVFVIFRRNFKCSERPVVAAHLHNPGA